jgi:putative endonuclease
MSYYVYIMTTQRNTALCTGITNNLSKRAVEHKLKLVKGFTKKYHVEKLVCFEVFEDVSEAIKREKQDQGKRR